MLNIFRLASLLEGCSYLVILCVSFGIISREFIFAIGMTHGVLFLLYAVLSLLASHKQAWSVVVWFFVLVASIVPFAFVAIEIFIKKELHRNEKST